MGFHWLYFNRFYEISWGKWNPLHTLQCYTPALDLSRGQVFSCFPGEKTKWVVWLTSSPPIDPLLWAFQWEESTTVSHIVDETVPDLNEREKKEHWDNGLFVLCRLWRTDMPPFSQKVCFLCWALRRIKYIDFFVFLAVFVLLKMRLDWVHFSSLPSQWGRFALQTGYRDKNAQQRHNIN